MNIIHIPRMFSNDGGNFEDVCICKECGARGQSTYGISRYGPCPKCGSTKIRTDVGRWINKTWQLRSEVPQKLKTAVEIANPPQGPIQQGDLARFNAAIEHLEAIRTKIRFVKARSHR